MSLKAALYVGCGAALGSMVRLATILALGPSFVTITLINICGCFAIGAMKPGPFWTIGFLGGFSSYSTYLVMTCLLYTSPSPRDKRQSRMPSSA